MHSHDGFNCQYSLAGVHGFERVAYLNIPDGGYHQHSIGPVKVSQDVKDALADGRTDDNKELLKGAKIGGEVTRYDKELRSSLLSKDDLKARLKTISDGDSLEELNQRKQSDQETLENAASYGLGKDSKDQLTADIAAIDKEIASRNTAATDVIKNYKNQTSLIGALNYQKDQIEIDKRDTINPIVDRARASLNRLSELDGDKHNWSKEDVENTLSQGRNYSRWGNRWAPRDGDDAVHRALRSSVNQAVIDYQRNSPDTFNDRIDKINDEIGDIKDSREDEFKKLSESQQDRLNDDIHGFVGLPKIEPKPSEKPVQGSTDSTDKKPKETVKRPTVDPDTKKPVNTGGAKGKPDPASDIPKPKTHTKAEVVASHNGLDRTYTVQRGDSYWRIADHYNQSYGTHFSWQDIYNANKDQATVVKGQAYIYTGQVFNIPGIGEQIDHAVEIGNAWEYGAYVNALNAAKEQQSTPTGSSGGARVRRF